MSAKDTYHFCFQASLWKRNECQEWYSAICDEVEKKGMKELELKMNIAENEIGQSLFLSLFEHKCIIGYIRDHKEPNAVYMSPWPYRPTAIIKGVIQPFAIELGEREGYRLRV
jgi:hypothetical protein